MKEESNEFTETFELQPETVIEAARHLKETGDTYNEFLAAELMAAFDGADVNLYDFRDDPPQRGPECPRCESSDVTIGFIADYDTLCGECGQYFDIRDHTVMGEVEEPEAEP